MDRNPGWSELDSALTITRIGRTVDMRRAHRMGSSDGTGVFTSLGTEDATDGGNVSVSSASLEPQALR